MAFREQLESLCESVDGALLGSVMGFDGIAIDTFERSDPGVDLPSLLVEYSTLLNQVRTATSVLQSGEVAEVVVSTEKLTIFSRALNSEYFLLLALAPQGNWGKARYMMRVAAAGLAVEF